MLVENLQSFLAASPTITAILGTAASRSDSTNGLFYEQSLDAPALTMPYIVYSQADGVAIAEIMAGSGLLRSAHWHIICHGSTAKQAKLLAMALKNALLVPYSVPSTQGIWLRREVDEPLAMAKGVIFTTTVTFEVLFSETQ